MTYLLMVLSTTQAMSALTLAPTCCHGVWQVTQYLAGACSTANMLVTICVKLASCLSTLPNLRSVKPHVAVTHRSASPLKPCMKTCTMYCQLASVPFDASQSIVSVSHYHHIAQTTALEFSIISCIMHGHGTQEGRGGRRGWCSRGASHAACRATGEMGPLQAHNLAREVSALSLNDSMMQQTEICRIMAGTN